MTIHSMSENKFKSDDKVVCIDNVGQEDVLEIGKIYTVEYRLGSSRIVLIGIKYSSYAFYTERFEKYNEENEIHNTHNF